MVRTVLIVILATQATAFVGSAVAQSSRDVATARRLFQQGNRAVEAEDWPAAVDAFRRSLEIAPRPVTRFNLASAEARAGLLVAATENYRVFLREATGRRYASLRQTAEEELEDAERRIGSMVLTVVNLSPGDVLQLDDGSLSRAVLGAAVPIDPGPHVVRGLREDDEVGTHRFSVDEGQEVEVNLVLDEPAATQTEGRDNRRQIDPEEITDEEEEEDEGGGIGSSPVFWTIVGLLVAGGLTAGGFFLFSEDADPFPGTAGVIRVR